MIGLLDTNVALYLLGGRLASPLPAGDYGVSVMTEMELLSWPGLEKEEEEKIQQFIRTVILCELTVEVRLCAVRLRREERLKLPDAIICATALVNNIQLWTNDVRLQKVPGLVFREVALAA